ncbi:MAG: right-handed parallel beta-helix repeat-containing protein [Cyclobacteriaceae bacterium]|nr:right-handed parallel beta-helix repeat-containing protein [Cyclobacteriaceae bacterium]
MKKLKILLSLVFISGLVFMFSCGDDDDDTPALNPPSVTAPSGTSDVESEGDLSLTFTVQAPAGYKSTSVTATGGTANVGTQPSAGATSGSVEVSFTAGTTAGAGSVTLTVTDNANQTDDATAVVSISASETEVTLTSNITEDATWTADKVYILGGRITVLDGVTLTIEPGTIIKGEAGTGSNATALLVARGGMLMAEGTAQAPIIFTSVADEIQPEDMAAGEFASPNLDPDVNGLWGGVLILGRAPISAKNEQGDVTELQIEGIPTSDPNGLFGGDDPSDNSGIITYISIRHGGTNIGSGNEINGLTLGGVGSGTTISNVEIVANQDDGIEWFGGTVSVTNAVVWNAGDDGIDTDQAWSGTVENFIVVNPGDRAFELDGPEGTFTSANHIIRNGTVYMGDGGVLIDFDANTDVDISEIYFYGFEAGPVVEQYADLTVGTASNFEVTLPAGVDKADVFVGMPDAEVVEVAENANTVGPASEAGFEWTWASQSGALGSIGL